MHGSVRPRKNICFQVRPKSGFGESKTIQKDACLLKLWNSRNLRSMDDTSCHTVVWFFAGPLTSPVLTAEVAEELLRSK